MNKVMEPELLALLTEEEQEIERRWRYGDGPVQRDVHFLLRSLAEARSMAGNWHYIAGTLGDERDTAIADLRILFDAVTAEFNTWQTWPHPIGQALRAVEAHLASSEEEK